MWPVLLAFLLITLACFAGLMLFVRWGRNRDDDVPAAGGRRPLIFGGLTRALAGILPVRPEARALYARFLRQAGHYHTQAVTEYLALRNALGVGGLLLVLAAVVVATNPGEPAMWQLGGVGLVVVILLFALPRLGLEGMAKARTRRVEESLPDAMDMITMCVSAGLPLPQSVTRVSEELRESHPDLAFELRIVGRQTEVGALQSAVRQFADRMDVPEIHNVATLVSQAEQQGASVAAAFRGFADQVRIQRRQRAEEAGNKKAFQLLFPVVFCLAPAVFVILLAPALLDLREFFRREGPYRDILQNRAQVMDSARNAAPGATAPTAPGPSTPAAPRPRTPAARTPPPMLQP